MKYIRLYGLMFKMNIKVMMQYRTDFFIGAFSTLLMQISSMVFLWAIFNNINNFAKWSFYEIVFTYGVFSICRGLNHIFFDNLWIIGREFLRKGTFDIIMVRPANSLFQILGQKIQPDGVGTFLFGITVTIISARKINMTFGGLDLLLIAFVVLMGTLVIALINLIFAVSSFWFLGSNNIMWMIFSLADFAQYPLTIYHPAIKFILTWVIPYGFVSYYPVSFILGKNGGNIIRIEVIVLVGLGLLARMLWKIGLKRYESAGN